MFERDGYHVERWPEVKSLSQLTDGHYHLILLDINGVGLNESPDLQGLGILDHVKTTNPAQSVIVYSAQKQRISANKYLSKADAVMDKGMSYVDYKSRVDQLLLSRATPAFFISVMNQELGESAALVPLAVKKALRSLDSGDISGFAKYMAKSLSDKERVDFLVGIISIGIQTTQALAGS